MSLVWDRRAVLCFLISLSNRGRPHACHFVRVAVTILREPLHDRRSYSVTSGLFFPICFIALFVV